MTMLLSAGIINRIEAVTIDNFDDGLDSGWSGDTTEFATDTSTVWEGAGSATTSTANTLVDIYSTSGLPNYFPKGNVQSVFSLAQAIGASGPTYQVWFGLSDTQNYYLAELAYDTGDIRLVRVEPDGSGGTAGTEIASATAAFSPTSGTWYELRVTWDDGTLGGADNDITVDYRDAAADSSLATLSGNDSTHATNTGVGHRLWDLDNGDLNLDYQHLRP